MCKERRNSHGRVPIPKKQPPILGRSNIRQSVPEAGHTCDWKLESTLGFNPQKNGSPNRDDENPLVNNGGYMIFNGALNRREQLEGCIFAATWKSRKSTCDSGLACLLFRVLLANSLRFSYCTLGLCRDISQNNAMDIGENKVIPQRA